MNDQVFNDFVPPEMREFAEHSVRQARKAFDDLMSTTQHAVSTFEGRATSAQSGARELQRKVVGFSERNVATSLEFAQKLLRAASPEEVMQLHSNYVRTQMQALNEQAQELAQHAAGTISSGTRAPS
jgi:phasin